MGARIFTDSEGNKFELITVGSGGSLNTGDLVIRPIKAVEKWDYRLCFDSINKLPVFQFHKDLKLTEPTAQKVAAYLEASLEAITTNNRRYFNGEVTECFKDAAKAFQEDV